MANMEKTLKTSPDMKKAFRKKGSPEKKDLKEWTRFQLTLKT